MTYCDEHEGGCGASLTETDYDAGYCTQCKRQLSTKETRTMSAQTMSEAFAPVEAANRAIVREATFGHLAAEKGKEYAGFIIFAIPEYDSGNPCIVSSRFEGLDDSPWLYDSMVEFAERRKRAGVYRFDGTVHNYRFKGTVTRIDCTSNQHHERKGE